MRNHQKSANINSLIHCNSIGGHTYKMLYFSRNLEHVLHNAPLTNDSAKMSLADQFDSQYKGKLNEFIKLVSDPEIAPSGNYNETWEFIQKGTNSLHRHSNLHLIFDPTSGLILPV